MVNNVYFDQNNQTTRDFEKFQLSVHIKKMPQSEGDQSSGAVPRQQLTLDHCYRNFNLRN